MQQPRSNYLQDRESQFRFYEAPEIALPAALTAHEYVEREKQKQMNRLRDWYIHSKSSAEFNGVALRSSFANSRNYDRTAVMQAQPAGRLAVLSVLFLAIVACGVFLATRV